MAVEARDLDSILAELALSPATGLVPLEGGSGDVYRVDLEDGISVVLKTFHGRRAGPEMEVHAAGLLAALDVPVTKYLLIDGSCTRLPCNDVHLAPLPPRRE